MMLLLALAPHMRSPIPRMSADADADALMRDLENFFAQPTFEAPTSSAEAFDTNLLPTNAGKNSLAIDFRKEVRRRQRANSGCTSLKNRPIVTDGVRPSRPPTFATVAHDLEDGFWECDLHEAKNAGKIIGRIAFIDRSPTEAGAAVSRYLGASVAELKHLDVAKHMRGHDGGRLLMAAMGEVLHGLSCDYVLLQHDDRGSRKLVSFYEALGFIRALDTMPEAEQHVEPQCLMHEKHMIAKLGEMRKALDVDD